MDAYTEQSAPGENLPMVMALLELWQTQYLGTDTHVVLPYAQKLRHLPDFLQQLTMESNGKRVSPEGEPLSHHSAPVLWGSAGTIGQHSYYQLLHQGTRAFTADIVLPLQAGEGIWRRGAPSQPMRWRKAAPYWLADQRRTRDNWVRRAGLMKVPVGNSNCRETTVTH